MLNYFQARPRAEGLHTCLCARTGHTPGSAQGTSSGITSPIRPRSPVSPPAATRQSHHVYTGGPPAASNWRLPRGKRAARGPPAASLARVGRSRSREERSGAEPAPADRPRLRPKPRPRPRLPQSGKDAASGRQREGRAGCDQPPVLTSAGMRGPGRAWPGRGKRERSRDSHCGSRRAAAAAVCFASAGGRGGASSQRPGAPRALARASHAGHVAVGRATQPPSLHVMGAEGKGGGGSRAWGLGGAGSSVRPASAGGSRAPCEERPAAPPRPSPPQAGDRGNALPGRADPTGRR